ncbi:MAG: SDR family oxidoreductase [Bdellovibrionales bacterium]|nr:SDR family oxidoreductase [Bdellovibrionales bacterium]
MPGEITKKFRLDGKTAIVTGGTGILGKHFCRGLAEFGANVAIVDRDPSSLKDFALELQKTYGVKALGIECDVANESSVQAMVKKAVAEFGAVHILHNNAATKTKDVKNFFAPTEKFRLEDWKEIMSVNVDGMFLVAREVGAQMLRQGIRGSIIQTGSIYGIMAPDLRIYEGSEYMGEQINSPAVYSASKAAVVGLTQYLASLWGAQGIRVNTLVPGGVQSGQNERFLKNYSARIPMGRMAQADEMVGALIYLASDASSYVTGQTLAIDGGLSAW